MQLRQQFHCAHSIFLARRSLIEFKDSLLQRIDSNKQSDNIRYIAESSSKGNDIGEDCCEVVEPSSLEIIPKNSSQQRSHSTVGVETLDDQIAEDIKSLQLSASVDADGNLRDSDLDKYVQRAYQLLRDRVLLQTLAASITSEVASLKETPVSPRSIEAYDPIGSIDSIQDLSRQASIQNITKNIPLDSPMVANLAGAANANDTTSAADVAGEVDEPTMSDAKYAAEMTNLAEDKCATGIICTVNTTGVADTSNTTGMVEETSAAGTVRIGDTIGAIDIAEMPGVTEVIRTARVIRAVNALDTAGTASINDALYTANAAGAEHTAKLTGIAAMSDTVDIAEAIYPLNAIGAADTTEITGLADTAAINGTADVTDIAVVSGALNAGDFTVETYAVDPFDNSHNSGAADTADTADTVDCTNIAGQINTWEVSAHSSDVATADVQNFDVEAVGRTTSAAFTPMHDETWDVQVDTISSHVYSDSPSIISSTATPSKHDTTIGTEIIIAVTSPSVATKPSAKGANTKSSNVNTVQAASVVSSTFTLLDYEHGSGCAIDCSCCRLLLPIDSYNTLHEGVDSVGKHTDRSMSNAPTGEELQHHPVGCFDTNLARELHATMFDIERQQRHEAMTGNQRRMLVGAQVLSLFSTSGSTESAAEEKRQVKSTSCQPSNASTQSNIQNNEYSDNIHIKNDKKSDIKSMISIPSSNSCSESDLISCSNAQNNSSDDKRYADISCINNSVANGQHIGLNVSPSCTRNDSNDHKTADASEVAQRVLVAAAPAAVGALRKPQHPASTSSKHTHTNFSQIKNAICNVCLAGGHQSERREEVLRILNYYHSRIDSDDVTAPLQVESAFSANSATVQHFVIMFSRSKMLSYRALYAAHPSTSGAVDNKFVQYKHRCPPPARCKSIFNNVSTTVN